MKYVMTFLIKCDDQMYYQLMCVKGIRYNFVYTIHTCIEYYVLKLQSNVEVL